MYSTLTTEIETPLDWPGTRPEYAIQWALIRLKIGFEFQSSKLGGRQERGGAILDFFLPEYNLAINIQSFYWHYGRPGAIASDLLQREALEGMGIKVIWIDEDDALRAPLYYTQEALKGNDFSKMVR